MKMELKKPLETHEHLVGNSWEFFSVVVPSFYSVSVVLSGDVVNSIFHDPLIIFVKGLTRGLCGVLYFIATGLN